MGYRVDYQPIKKVRRLEKQHAVLPALTALCFALFILLVTLFWDRGAEVFWNLVFSGDVAVTANALEAFAQELEAGIELRAALETFCRTVIQNGESITY